MPSFSAYVQVLEQGAGMVTPGAAPGPMSQAPAPPQPQVEAPPEEAPGVEPATAPPQHEDALPGNIDTFWKNALAAVDSSAQALTAKHGYRLFGDIVERVKGVADGQRLKTMLNEALGEAPEQPQQPTGQPSAPSAPSAPQAPGAAPGPEAAL